uniref:23S rRNA (adenine(2030)-N(6))-methyltransferase RlmJ n=1 Tax=Ningiella ruwaisensis TaxID=2364274 RepID=UPI0010A0B0D2|nr:23S rRNA (adenine(2030)-N(6))-methyltransferase RlmJ [Ningiella ruwaisensis]
MLSYQHAYHAGNHADVLKHLVIIATQLALNKKNKPYFVLDSHAGEGLYMLSHRSEKADAAAFEHLLGLPTDDKTEQALQYYIEVVKASLENGFYPGSPFIVSKLAREFDNIQVNELSGPIANQLNRHITRYFYDNTRVQVHHRDAFEAIKALIPPSPNRGMLIIDPPYEQAEEYQQVVQAISQSIQKWHNGIYLIWYPLLSPKRINHRSGELEASPKAHLANQMLEQLSDLSKTHVTGGMLSLEFAYQQATENVGMYGSGMCIINPPFKIEESLRNCLNVLETTIAKDNNSSSSNIKWWQIAQ